MRPRAARAKRLSLVRRCPTHDPPARSNHDFHDLHGLSGLAWRDLVCGFRSAQYPGQALVYVGADQRRLGGFAVLTRYGGEFAFIYVAQFLMVIGISGCTIALRLYLPLPIRPAIIFHTLIGMVYYIWFITAFEAGTSSMALSVIFFCFYVVVCLILFPGRHVH